MKMPELKTGMKIVLNNGDIGVVLLDTERGDIISGTASGTAWRPLESVTFNPNANGDFDAVAVYANPDRNWAVLGNEVESLGGYTKIWPGGHVVSIDGVKRKISDESFEALKDVFGKLD